MTLFCKHKWETLLIVKKPAKNGWLAIFRILLACKICGKLTIKELIGEEIVKIK